MSFWISFIAFLAFGANFDQGCSALLLKQLFIQPHPYARELHRKVVPAKKSFLKELNWPFKNQEQLDNIADRFSFLNIKMRFEIYGDSRKDSPHIVMLFTFFENKKPIGFIARQILKNKRHELEAHGEGFYFSPSYQSKGIAKYALDFIDSQIYKKLDVRKEILHANYIGRYFWARLGYDFHSMAYYWPQGNKVKGTSIKPLDMARKNFERFLKFHHIDFSELSIQSIEEFNKPVDFANVYHKKGKKLLIRPLISEQELGEAVEMPIGKAFMLSDNRPTQEEPYICSPMGKKFSIRAMPKWHGVRVIRR